MLWLRDGNDEKHAIGRRRRKCEVFEPKCHHASADPSDARQLSRGGGSLEVGSWLRSLPPLPYEPSAMVLLAWTIKKFFSSLRVLEG
jgi:hypothetical protein